ncbi:MAG: VWA domain-containing protein [Thermoguttaceae bacterium]|nr:VWA domain-containing protein [Thermoguttaceae bacterium]
MSGTQDHYKSKLSFWKWKARKSAAAEGKSAEKTPFWTSWTGSLAVHAAALLLLVAVLAIDRPVRRALKGRADGEVSFLFSDEEPAGGGNTAETPNENPAADPVSAETPETADDPVPNPEEDVIGTAPAVIAHVRFHDSGSEGGGSGPAGISAGDGTGTGQTVRFGDLQGRGKRFVFLVDRSESMKWPDGDPIRVAVADALASIGSLDPAAGAQKFQLIAFNHHYETFNGGKRLVEVTSETKRQAESFLSGLAPDGGTDPLAALDAAIRMAPDVIFFLTDAEEEISALSLRRIRDLARQGSVAQIHVIEFGKPGGKHPAAYRKLAEQNGGAYVYRDVTALE